MGPAKARPARAEPAASGPAPAADPSWPLPSPRSEAASGLNSGAERVGQRDRQGQQHQADRDQRERLHERVHVPEPEVRPPCTNGIQSGPRIMLTAVPSRATISDSGWEAQEPPRPEVALGPPEAGARTVRAGGRAGCRLRPRSGGTRASTPSSERASSASTVASAAGHECQRQQRRDHQRRDDQPEAQAPERHQADEPDHRPAACRAAGRRAVGRSPGRRACGRSVSTSGRLGRTADGDGRSGAPARAASRLTRGSQARPLGRYQFQSPSIFIVAGSRIPRITVASSRTATASPTPICLMSSVGSQAKIANTATITAAAAVTVPAVDADPARHGVRGRQAAVVQLLDAADDEHVVVHRQAEQHREQEQRQPGDDGAVGVESEQALQVAAPGRSRRAPRRRRRPTAGSATIDVSGITSDRNVTSSSRNASPSTKANTSGKRVLDQCVEVVGAGGLAGDRELGSAAAVRAWPAALGRAASGARSSRLVSLPLPTSGTRIWAAVWLRLTVVWIGRLTCPLASASASKRADRGSALRRGHVVVADDHHRRGLRARERLLDLLVVGDDRDAVRQVAGPEQRRVQAERRQRQAHAAARPRAARRAAGGAEPGAAPRSRPVTRDARCADPALVDLVAEPTEQRRQHGQRADHRREHDQHRADPDRVEHAAAGQQHAGHRDQHRDPGGEHGASRGRRGALERVARPCPARRSSRSRLR